MSIPEEPVAPSPSPVTCEKAATVTVIVVPDPAPAKKHASREPTLPITSEWAPEFKRRMAMFHQALARDSIGFASEIKTLGVIIRSINSSYFARNHNQPPSVAWARQTLQGGTYAWDVNVLQLKKSTDGSGAPVPIDKRVTVKVSPFSIEYHCIESEPFTGIQSIFTHIIEFQADEKKGILTCVGKRQSHSTRIVPPYTVPSAIYRVPGTTGVVNRSFFPFTQRMDGLI